MKKLFILPLLALLSCTAASSAQTSDPNLYDAGNGIYYMTYENMRQLLPALSNFKQEHKECKITSMSIMHGCPMCSVSLLINCEPQVCKLPNK